MLLIVNFKTQNFSCIYILDWQIAHRGYRFVFAREKNTVVVFFYFTCGWRRRRCFPRLLVPECENVCARASDGWRQRLRIYRYEILPELDFLCFIIELLKIWCFHFFAMFDPWLVMYLLFKRAWCALLSLANWNCDKSGSLF